MKIQIVDFTHRIEAARTEGTDVVVDKRHVLSEYCRSYPMCAEQDGDDYGREEYEQAKRSGRTYVSRVVAEFEADTPAQISDRIKGMCYDAPVEKALLNFFKGVL